jgi:hypothetical protein
METPAHLESEDGYVSYRPIGVVSLKEGVDLISGAIAYCAEKKSSRLLVSVTGLTGYHMPQTMDRYSMGVQFAEASKFGLRVALVAPLEVIDPQRFGMTVAQNRGLDVNVFSSEPEALAWLLSR